MTVFKKGFHVTAVKTPSTATSDSSDRASLQGWKEVISGMLL